MKLFLLITHDQDDFDCVYGVFDSREKAEAERLANKFRLISCAQIVELELNACSGPEHSKGECAIPEWYLKMLAKSPYADLLP